MSNFLLSGESLPSGTEPGDFGFNDSVEIVYAAAFWPPGSSREEPDLDYTESYINWRFEPEFSGRLVIDIEHWPVGYQASDTERAESISKYIAVLEKVRAMLPDAEIGLYGVLPIREYWAYAIDMEGRIDAIDRAHDQLEVLAEHVDFVAPSLYTFYNDPEGWRVYAEANLANANSFGLPVYAFLWPQYHYSNAVIGGSDIEKDFFIEQIELVSERADGAIIWSVPGHMTTEWLETMGPEIQRIVLSANYDLVFGTRSADRLVGNQDADYILGKNGNDSILGHGGSDVLKGGVGRDSLYGNNGDDVLRGGRGGDTLVGGAGNDKLRGSNGQDILSGGSGNDSLRGGIGHDKLRGGNGDDFIRGCKGDDKLRGGDGSDVFLFRDNDGYDRVLDFDAKGRFQDVIDLSDVGAVSSWEDLKHNHLVDVENGVWIRTDSVEIFLKGVDLVDLNSQDFIF